MSKLLDNYPDPILKIWIYHEALNKLGYSSRDIYVLVGNNCTQVILKISNRSMIMEVSNLDKNGISLDIEKVVGLWQQFTKDIKEIPDDELQEVWDSDLHWLN